MYNRKRAAIKTTLIRITKIIEENAAKIILKN